MTSVYAGDLAAAREMLRDFGATTVIKRELPTPYSSQQGPGVAPEPLETAVYLVVLPVSGRGETFENLSMLRTRARIFYLGFPTDTDPLWKVQPGDLLYFEQQWWPISGVDPLNPDDTTAILYSGQMRLP